MKKIVKYILFTYVFFSLFFLLTNYLPQTKAKYISKIPDRLKLTIQKPTYNIRFDANGGTGTMSDMVNLKYGTTYTLTQNVFTNTGYIFISWNTKRDGTGTTYQDIDSISNLSTTNGAIVTLYAMWGNGIAELDGVLYNSIKAAINAVPANGVQKTINVLQNVSETQNKNQNEKIIQGQNIVINLQNHTITNDTTYPIFENYGTLKIINGTIQSSDIATDNKAVQSPINNNGSGANLILENVTIESIGTRTKQALYNDGGTMTIQGNSYIHTSNVNGGNEYNKPAIGTLANGTLIIKEGVTVVSDYHAGIKVENSTLIIGTKDNNVNGSSPVIQGKTVGVEMTSTSSIVKYYDGLVKGAPHAFTNYQNVNDVELNYEINVSTTEVIGGTTYEVATLVQSALSSYVVTFNPMGGRISETQRSVLDGDPVGQLPTPVKGGYTFAGWYDSNNNPITSSTTITENVEFYAHWTHIANFDCNVMLGEEEFTNFTDAINAASNGDTLELTDNMTTKLTVPSNKNITLDLGTYTLQNSSNNDPIINNQGTLTVKNGVMNTSSGATTAAINNTGNIIIDGTTINTTGSKQAVYNNNANGTMIIRGNSHFTSASNNRATITNNAGTTIIESGYFESTAFAAVSIANGTVIIGTEGSGVDTTSPVLVGYTHAVDNSGNKTLKWYDGILKGRTNYVTGNITAMESGYTPQTGTDGDYTTAILVSTS